MEATLSDEFCRWLQQYLPSTGADSLIPSQVWPIRQRLSNVFRHEIDPTMGDAAHQRLLQAIHPGISNDDTLKPVRSVDGATDT
jgi:hypothetical protein